MEGSISTDDTRGQINFPGACTNSMKASEFRRQGNEKSRRNRELRSILNERVRCHTLTGPWTTAAAAWHVLLCPGQAVGGFSGEGLPESLGMNPAPLPLCLSASVLGSAHYQGWRMEMQYEDEKGGTGNSSREVSKLEAFWGRQGKHCQWGVLPLGACMLIA